MKRNVPTIRISVTIYDLMMIHDGILPVTDHKREEVKNNENYKSFVQFITEMCEIFHSYDM